MWAVSQKHPECVAVLLGHGASLGEVTEEGKSLHQWATEEGCAELMELIEELEWRKGN